MILLNDITMYYSKQNKNTPIFQNVSIQFNKGNFVSIIGKSGCGKTTLLKTICGLITPNNGNVTINDFNPEDYWRIGKISYVPQENTLFEWLNILQNITLPLRIKKIFKDDENIFYWLNKFDLAKLKNKRPSEISGGEKVRCEIAKALLLEPEILILDEPLRNLDRSNSKLINDVLNDTKASNSDLTILMVTHDIQSACILSDKILIINRETEDKPSYITELSKDSFQGDCVKELIQRL